jgi:Nucleoside-diphosphate-sugar epimerases
LRYVISGAAGFIGSHLCETLLGEGHSVVGLDNLITGSRDNIEHLTNNPKFEFHEVDVTHSVAVGGKCKV